ncbi:hypothetical protein AKJ62_01315 [candidate division MSBL1 archaeon SCGC-AAA259D14]|uniref:Uncharacterized protein n=1 Tax=candidate division MSBL1 archaeon SCGC-AAA259D14 TaxID=1698261 RepID=A0A133U7U1_9EURY|nr:hypothetical protein AKJ62_01315 [candidate division MSBL1 archaeon SCGC-AAA259D14]
MKNARRGIQRTRVFPVDPIDLSNPLLPPCKLLFLPGLRLPERRERWVRRSVSMLLNHLLMGEGPGANYAAQGREPTYGHPM